MKQEQIEMLDALPEGERVTVAYTQGGGAVCCIAGRWRRRRHPWDGWSVWGRPRRCRTMSQAHIIPADAVVLFWDQHPRHIRVDLTGRRGLATAEREVAERAPQRSTPRGSHPMRGKGG